MIDVDESGDLEKQEIVGVLLIIRVAVKSNFRHLRNCCFRVFGVWWCGIIQVIASRFVLPRRK